MNGVHDMGGLEGLGPLQPETSESGPFRAAWEGRVHALVLASPTRGNIDAGRFQRELIPGPLYLSLPYYGRWLEALEAMLLGSGLVEPDELQSGRARPGAPRRRPRLPVGEVTAGLTQRGSYQRPAPGPPAFAEGDEVLARTLNPSGHTRLPRYLRGRRGVVDRVHGAHVFPDAHAAGLGEDPQHLYTVRFTARELWGPAASPVDSLRADLFEPYLARA